jgi:hypothetical protein
MIILIIGGFHLIHSPLLILFPFFIKNHVLDIFYIIYFFAIMFLYTFIDGECPISYICKKIKDKNYIAGDNITYYPEMEYIFQNKIFIDYYFGTMTIIYILTLFFVIFRTNIFCYFLTFVFFILLIYFLLIRNIFSLKQGHFFITFQEFTKYLLLLTICFLLTHVTF